MYSTTKFPTECPSRGCLVRALFFPLSTFHYIHIGLSSWLNVDLRSLSGARPQLSRFAKVSSKKTSLPQAKNEIKKSMDVEVAERQPRRQSQSKYFLPHVSYI